MGLALALEKEPELVAPTDLVTVPPRLVELARPTEHGGETVYGNRSAFLQAVQLAEQFPGSATALSRLSTVALIEGEDDLARTSALAAIRYAVEQNDQPALISAAQALVILGEADIAADAMRQVDGSVAVGVAYGEILAAQGEFDAALAAIGSAEDPVAAALRGWIRLEQGEYAHAIHEFRRSLLSGGPPRVDVLTNIGFAYAALGQWEKAHSATRQALHVAPSSRVVALNLVAYDFAAGNVSSALRFLLEIRRRHPEDIMLYAAVAEARLRLGDTKGALKELRSARDLLSKIDISVRHRAEILANTVFMEWRVGKKSTDEAIEAIRKELLRCRYESLDIGRMLARLLTRLSQLGQLETLYRGLSEAHSRSALYEFETQLDFMRGEFGKALSAAKRWSREDPFDPAAAVTTTYLLAEVEGKYEEAARFGEDALRRVPSSVMLRNNVAFGWAMAGKPQRAMKYLSGIPETSYTLATSGLIELVRGNLVRGNADYERGALLAERDGKPDVAKLIRLRRLIALLEFGKPVDEEPRLLLEGLKDSDDPMVLVLRRQARQFA